jgi:hypothetical protein
LGAPYNGRILEIPSMRPISQCLCAVLVLCTVAVVDAQWIKLPTPGLPRHANGKPNLDAPVPRTADGKPDFSGLWKNDGGDRYYNNILADLKTSDVAPWAHELFMKRSLEFGKDSMETQCLPLGPAYLTTRYRDYRIVQTPTLIMVAYEDGMHRQIWMDGRSLEPEPNPTWMGYSVGRWDGDTLVVESNGFTERSWLDFGGHPHTEALRITERYTRRTVGRLEVQITLTDAKVFAKPITLTIPIKLLPDTEMLEGFCENHHKSRERMASTKAATVVNVPAATLSRYIGSYQTDESYDGMTHDMAVTLDGSELWFDYEGKGKELLIALTPARFSWSGSIVEFSPGSAGAMNITIHYVEGTERGVRRK